VANQGNGIAIRAYEYGYDNTIGGTSVGAANTIADNGEDGVLVDTGTGNVISQNAIFGNAGLGIELRNDGNQDQAAPDLLSARSDGTSTAVVGALRGAPATAFTLEFFVNPVCDSSGFGQGQSFLGSAQVTTDATGQADFTATLGVGASAGQFVTATATDPAGNTSAFSNCVPVERSAADPGGAGMQDVVLVSGRNVAPAPSSAPVPGAPFVPGRLEMPAGSALALPAPSLGAGTDVAPEAGPPAVGMAPVSFWPADDLAALALQLLGGP
jgi:hypothetical protein